MTAVDPGVRAAWPTFTRRFEGRIAWMYLDAKGLVTVGLGCILEPITTALALPWHVSGESFELVADEDAIRTNWQRVKAMAPDLEAHHYDFDGALFLDDTAIDELARVRLEAEAELLARFWPDFGDFPPSAQQALLSMAWGLGAGGKSPGLTSSEWPRLQAAVRDHNWAAAAAECKMTSPGVDERNAANRALFLEAAAAS